MATPRLAATLTRQTTLAMRPARFATAAALAMLARFDPLAIDDLRCLCPSITQGARLPFHAISRAYETQSPIITTNPPSAWEMSSATNT